MIICAAIIVKEGKMYVGINHYSSCNAFLRNPCEGSEITEGFLNDKGRFLDRIAAFDEAAECGQIKNSGINKGQGFLTSSALNFTAKNIEDGKKISEAYNENIKPPEKKTKAETEIEREPF